MKKTSWKTTSTGITMIVAGVVGGYFAMKSGNINEATVMASFGSIMGGVGMIFAKDHNVSGTK